VTFVDITFASLGAIAVLPPNYGGGAITGGVPRPGELASPWREEVEAFRRTATGRYILRLYDEERRAMDRLRKWGHSRRGICPLSVYCGKDTNGWLSLT